MDSAYARRIGVNIDELLVSQPDNGEQALEITELLIRSGALDIVVIDSVAALTPRAEIEGEMGDSHVGLQARLMSQALRKLAGTISKTQTTRRLHQPVAGEGRGHVRQSRGHSGRPGAQVLRVGAAGHPAHRDAQGRHRGGRQPGARAGGEEQGRSAVQGSRVRHHVRSRHLHRGRRPRPGGGTTRSFRRAAPGSRTATSAWARDARTFASSCATIPSWSSNCGARSSRRSIRSGTLQGARVTEVRTECRPSLRATLRPRTPAGRRTTAASDVDRRRKTRPSRSAA